MQGIIDIVWIEFANIKVGLTEQATMQHLNTPQIMHNWIAIKRISIKMPLGNRNIYIRAQFPIQIASG